MRACHQVEITTPKGVVLNGLWFGPQKARRAIIFVHGLAGSAFSRLPIVDELVDKETAVLTFNNRGHDRVSYVARGKKKLPAGSAHEVFTQCIDDIDGAIAFALSLGAKKIFLAGHSTGCQKCVYWTAKRGKGVKGLMLLAPVSDRAAHLMDPGARVVAKAESVARAFVRSGRPHDLLPAKAWPFLIDAQRLLSLVSKDSMEELFPYGQTNRVPKMLRKIQLPIQVLWAGAEEYADRPAVNVQDWFAEHLKVGDEFVIVPRVSHSFAGGEKRVAQTMRTFMNNV